MKALRSTMVPLSVSVLVPLPATVTPPAPIADGKPVSTVKVASSAAPPASASEKTMPVRPSGKKSSTVYEAGACTTGGLLEVIDAASAAGVAIRGVLLIVHAANGRGGFG